jgi:branched-chain amino acid transport system permease protein
MSLSLLLEQVLNGFQYGIFLFLMAAGLTLVFGIMNFVNLAHGSLFMIGAYIASAIYQASDSFLLSFLLAPLLTAAVGYVVERLLLYRFYARDHLDQVMVTFALLIFANQLVILLFGAASQPIDAPTFLTGMIQIIPGVQYPDFRLAIIGVGVLVALLCYVVISRTRWGALVRAGASNPAMLGSLGVNVRLLHTAVFCAGTALAALAGTMAGPILSVEPGMGDEMLILAFVVIVIGGIGSIRGALIASIVVGVAEVAGRSSLKLALAGAFGSSIASTAAPAIASMSIYLFMAIVLFFRPQGLLAARTG